MPKTFYFLFWKSLFQFKKFIHQSIVLHKINTCQELMVSASPRTDSYRKLSLVSLIFWELHWLTRLVEAVLHPSKKQQHFYVSLLRRQCCLLLIRQTYVALVKQLWLYKPKHLYCKYKCSLGNYFNPLCIDNVCKNINV